MSVAEVARIGLVCLLLSIGAGAAAGQFPASSLRIEVDGPIATSATVTVAAPDGFTHERIVDALHRVADVAALLPGTYDLRVSLPDGRAARSALTVDASESIRLIVTIPTDGASAPAIVRRTVVPIGEGPRFDRQTLDRLPAVDAWGLAETAAPFVVADRLDTGGVGTGRSALLGARGESWALTRADVAGILVRAPTATGQLPAALPLLAAESVALLSGVAPAEVDTPGVVVAVSPRRPAARWSGGADVAFTTPAMVGENATRLAPAFQRVEDYREANAFAGGPVSRGSGVFAAVRTARVSFLENEEPTAFSADTTSGFAHVVARPARTDQVRLVGGVDRAQAPYAARHQFDDPRVDETSSFARVGAVWDHASALGQRRSIAVSIQRNRWQPSVAPAVAGGVVERVSHGVVPTPPADVTHLQWDALVDWGRSFGRARRTHDIRAGVSFRRSRLTSDIVALPTVAESVAGLAARIWVPETPDSASRRSATEVGWYLADRIAVGTNVSADIGLRGDIVRASAAGAVNAIAWHTISPRASVRWQLGPLAVVGGVGRYAGGHPLMFSAYGDPGEATWDVYRWLDDGDVKAEPGERGALVARAGAGDGVGGLDPDLRVPTTVEWTAGGDLRLSRYSTLRGSIIIRRQTNLVGVVNRGVGPSDYRVFFVPDINADEGSPADDQLLPIYERLPSSFGRDDLLLTNPDTDPVRHDGIELTYELRSPRWMMLFGATAYRTLGRGGLLGYGPLENDALVAGDRFWNPNLIKDEAGRLFFDRAYVGKWVITHTLPGDVSLGAIVRYQDGQPFTRYVVAADLASGPELTQAYSVGRTRFTYTATLDARVQKTFRLGQRRGVAIRLDAFNLTNHANELAEDVLTGPDFRRSTITQPPRTFRFGLRFDF